MSSSNESGAGEVVGIGKATFSVTGLRVVVSSSISFPDTFPDAWQTELTLVSQKVSDGEVKSLVAVLICYIIYN